MLSPSFWHCLFLLILLGDFRASIQNVLVPHSWDEKIIFLLFVTFSILHCSCSHEHLMRSSSCLPVYFFSPPKIFSLFLESVFNSREDWNTIMAKGKGKQRNVRDKYSSGKVLEAKLGVKVICDVRGKISFLTCEFGIIWLLEDNSVQDLSLGFFFACLVVFCSILVLQSSGQALKESLTRSRFFGSGRRGSSDTLQSLSLCWTVWLETVNLSKQCDVLSLHFVWFASSLRPVYMCLCSKWYRGL